MTEEEKQAEILAVLDRVYELWQSVAKIIDGRLKVRKEVRTNRDNWDQICSSSDAINDTVRAIESYVKSDYPEDDVGRQYISIYGLFQALYLQQDAVENLFKTLHKCYQQSEGFCYKRSDELKEVRLLRNETIGHPTRTHSGIFTYINRGSLNKWHFERLRSSKTEGNEFLSVDLFSVMKKQALAIKNDLEILVKEINEADRMDYEKYKNRLAAICGGNIEYLLQTVAEGISSPLDHDRIRGLDSLGTIEGKYSEFEAGMKERGLIDFYELEDYKRAISVLKEYLAGEKVAMKEEDARIYYFYLEKQHEYFKEMVEEIDSQYRDHD